MNRNQAQHNNNTGYNNNNNQASQPFYFHPNQYAAQPHPPPQVQPTPQQHFFHSALPSSSSNQPPSSSNSGNNTKSSPSLNQGPILPTGSQSAPPPKTAEERDEAIASLEKRRDAIKFTIANLQSEKELARLSGRPFQNEHTLNHLKDTRESLSDQLIDLMQMKVASGIKRSRPPAARGSRALKPGWSPGATFGAHQASEAWNRAIPNRHVGIASGLEYKPHELLFPPRKNSIKKDKGDEEDEDEEDIENELGMGGSNTNGGNSSSDNTLANLSKALCGRCRVGHGSHKISGIGRYNNSDEDFRVQEGSFSNNPNTYSGSSIELAQSTPCGCVISDVLLQFFIFKSVRLTHDRNSKLYNQACPWFSPEQLQYLKVFLWKFLGVNLDSLYQPNQRARFLSIRTELDRRLSNENELTHWWEFIGKVDELTIDQVEYCLKMEEEEKAKKRKIAEDNKKANAPPSNNAAASTTPRGAGRPRKAVQPSTSGTNAAGKGRKEIQRG